MSIKPLHELNTVVVRGATIGEALANVKRLYGPAAAVVQSREARTRSDDDLGENRGVEVLVALDTEVPTRSVAEPVAEHELLARLNSEVARVEALTETVRGRSRPPADPDQGHLDAYPLAAALLRSGVTRPAVVHLARLWAAESAGRPDADPRRSLATQIQTSRAHWTTLGGSHVFLGEAGAGKSAIVEAAAARLHHEGQRVLVLSVAPAHGGVIRRLQDHAKALGVDAAVLRRGDQLERATKAMRGYDTVLIDTPPLDGEALAEPRLRRVLAEDERFHRHLVQPLDADAAADVRQWGHARAWNCDWIAVSRRDLAARPGRLLELAMAAPHPVSLTTCRDGRRLRVEIAEADRLAAELLGATAPRTLVMED